MQRDDHEYFRRRERDERAFAERASDQSARHAHKLMADRYAERLRDMPVPPSASRV